MRIYSEPARDEELRRYGTASVACGSGVAIAGDSADYAVRGDLANDVVACVGDVEVALMIHGQAFWGAQLSGSRGPIVAAKARSTGPGHGGLGAVWINLYDL